MNIIEKIIGLTLVLGTKRDERGATATEYALLVVGIALLLGAATLAFGGALSAFFTGLPARLGF
jgi:pilus assembly protein Flp/PilA